MYQMIRRGLDPLQTMGGLDTLGRRVPAGSGHGQTANHESLRLEQAEKPLLARQIYSAHGDDDVSYFPDMVQDPCQPNPIAFDDEMVVNLAEQGRNCLTIPEQ